MKRKLEEAGCDFVKVGEGIDAKWVCILMSQAVARSKSLGDCIAVAAKELGE